MPRSSAAPVPAQVSAQAQRSPGLCPAQSSSSQSRRTLSSTQPRSSPSRCQPSPNPVQARSCVYLRVQVCPGPLPERTFLAISKDSVVISVCVCCSGRLGSALARSGSRGDKGCRVQRPLKVIQLALQLIATWNVPIALSAELGLLVEYFSCGKPSKPKIVQLTIKRGAANSELVGLLIEHFDFENKVILSCMLPLTQI